MSVTAAKWQDVGASELLDANLNERRLLGRVENLA